MCEKAGLGVESHQEDALPGHPADGQHGSALNTIVISAVQVPAHAKVSDLNGVVFAHQAVSGGEVPVHKVQ